MSVIVVASPKGGVGKSAAPGGIARRRLLVQWKPIQDSAK
jgi:septum formation inhibitor-activating ATPase MinD